MASKKKTEKKENLVDIEFNDKALKKEMKKKEKQFQKGFSKTRGQVEDFVDENMDLKELEKEIRDRPLTYAALAFTAGIAIGSLFGRK